MDHVLEVKNLTTRFHLINHTVNAVSNLSFTVGQNEILALAGESGCGKSATILSILRLISPPGKIDGSSEIIFQNQNLLQLTEHELNKIRGKDISMIFQEPSASFNPLFTVGGQIAEVLRIHEGLDKKEAFERAVDLFRQVRIPNPERRAFDFPFQLSGGMLQRAMIALSIACSPKILLADEPTTALDPTTQIGILDLLREKVAASKMSVIFVTHDLDLLGGFADKVIVMYAGKIFEMAPAQDLLKKPLHPYTMDLLASIPRGGVFKENRRLFSIRGKVPDPGTLITGCPYHPRCTRAFAKCRFEEPPLFGREQHRVGCWLYE